MTRQISYSLQAYTPATPIKAVDESLFITLAINPFIDVVFDYSCGLSKDGWVSKYNVLIWKEPNFAY